MTAKDLLGLTCERLLAKWPQLVVHDEADEIQEADTRAYACHPDGQFEAVFNDDDIIDTVFVYRESPLLEGLASFSASRGMVLERFGKPSISGEERVDELLGAQGAWDRFDYPTWSLHFQYAYGGDRIHLVTLMSADVARSIGSSG